MPAIRALLVLLTTLLVACSGERVYERGLDVARGMAGLSPNSIEIGTDRIAYLERDGPGDTIVLLHGFASEKDAWLMFARWIPDSYRIIAMDLPGHGNSSFDPAKSWTAQAIAERAGAAVDGLAPGRFHIVGNSLGGMVAMLIASARAERVLSVGLFDAAGVHPTTASDFQLAIERGENPLIVRNAADFERLLDYVFYDVPFMPWPVRSVLTERLMARAPINAQIWQELWVSSETLDGVLPGLNLPVFILWGAEDRVLDPSSAEVFASQLPDARVVVLPGVGHSPMVEKPKYTARIYLDFIVSAGR